MDGEQGDGVLVAEAGGIQLLAGLLLEEEVEVVEEGGQRGPPLDRAPFLGEIEEAVEVEAGRQPSRGVERLHLGPGTATVEDPPAQLDQCHTLSLTEQLPVDAPEMAQATPDLLAEAFDLRVAVGRLQQGPPRDSLPLVALVGPSVLHHPGGQGSQISQSQAVGAAEEDAHQGGGIVGLAHQPQPGMKVGHLGDVEQAAEGGHLYRNLGFLESEPDLRHLGVLAEQHRDVGPGQSFLVVEPPHGGGDPRCLVGGGPQPCMADEARPGVGKGS